MSVFSFSTISVIAASEFDFSAVISAVCKSVVSFNRCSYSDFCSAICFSVLTTLSDNNLVSASFSAFTRFTSIWIFSAASVEFRNSSILPSKALILVCASSNLAFSAVNFLFSAATISCSSLTSFSSCLHCFFTLFNSFLLASNSSCSRLNCSSRSTYCCCFNSMVLLLPSFSADRLASKEDCVCLSASICDLYPEISCLYFRSEDSQSPLVSRNCFSSSIRVLR
mmetsp:Transcript_32426/g.52538  ORF Transcript_32426/g.52538 Transcript_32426/m.52538 type:complete len:225 (-) Transcript_32426:1175-1849(-)